MEERKPKRRRKGNKFAKAVNTIQESALRGGGQNLVSRELSYQQALSIHLRSKQLARESSRSSNIKPEILAQQVERCYEQRKRQRFKHKE